ncbi:MAG: hypothetical protein ACP5U1_00890 [Desulfomonilaceae bacterium]
MKRSYIDTNVLIYAFRGEDIISLKAMAVLEDTNRRLVVRDYPRLDVLP